MKHSELRHQPRHVNPRIQDINKYTNEPAKTHSTNTVISLVKRLFNG